MDLTTTIRTLIPAIEDAVAADATTVTLNNGPAAGQEVPHVHWHIVPRFHDDGTVVEYHSLVDGELATAEMESIAADIRAGQ